MQKELQRIARQLLKGKQSIKKVSHGDVSFSETAVNESAEGHDIQPSFPLKIHINLIKFGE